MLLPLLICAYIFLNLNDACAQVPTFISYDFWRLKKKWHHQWWKSNLVIYFYFFNDKRKVQRSVGMVEIAWTIVFLCWFVIQQIMGIVGSRIKVTKVFNIEGICMKLRCFQLGIEKFEMVKSIYKNWLNDAMLVPMKPWKNSWKWKMTWWQKMRNYWQLGSLNWRKHLK